MITISRTVEKIIEENSFIQEALSRGIINYAALAESIKPIIENEMKKQVKTSAIMMSLRRLTEKLERVFVKKPKFEKEAYVFVKSDLFEITIKKSKIDQESRKYEFGQITKPNLNILKKASKVNNTLIIISK